MPRVTWPEILEIHAGDGAGRGSLRSRQKRETTYFLRRSSCAGSADCLRLSASREARI
jgi:hypothetical protein